MTRRAVIAGIAGSALAGTTLLLAPTASASEVEKHGACTSSSRWEAETGPEHGGFEVKFEVRSATAGESWRVVISQNGDRVYANTSTTSSNRKHGDDDKGDDDSGGSRQAPVEWRVDRPNTAGTDTFAFRATNQATGEVCRATITG